MASTTGLVQLVKLNYDLACVWVYIGPTNTNVQVFFLYFNNENIGVPHLVKIAIAHYQFETIHPFLEGNGRIGRLLITLYLVSNKILDEPLLYLSDFFEKNKGLYYDNLTFVRTKNDLAQWIKFFLTGVIATAENGVATLRKIVELKERIEKEKILNMGKRAQRGLRRLRLKLRRREGMQRRAV